MQVWNLGYHIKCEYKSVMQQSARGAEVQINLNLNMESETEELLIKMFGNTENAVEKAKIYDTMFLYFAVSFNCLRPQTGGNMFLHINIEFLNNRYITGYSAWKI